MDNKQYDVWMQHIKYTFKTFYFEIIMPHLQVMPVDCYTHFWQSTHSLYNWQMIVMQQHSSTVMNCSQRNKHKTYSLLSDSSWVWNYFGFAHFDDHVWSKDVLDCIPASLLLFCSCDSCNSCDSVYSFYSCKPREVFMSYVSPKGTDNSLPSDKFRRHFLFIITPYNTRVKQTAY